MRQYNRDRPYDPEHRASLARKAQPPKNLLQWFLEAYRAEAPEKIHASDVWRDRVSEDEARIGIQAVGGSLLGTPRTNDTFRRYIEDSPFATEVAEYEGSKDRSGHYAFPLRAALARLAGRGPDSSPFPFMARALYRTALRDGDFDSACASLGICEPVRQVYIEEALRRLWAKYEIEPPARTLRTEAA
jgi:hypothetical protein